MVPVHAGKEPGMENPRQFTIFCCLFSLFWMSIAHSADSPPPTPTPKPGTLAAVAGSRPLQRVPGLSDTGIIVITDDNLSSLGQNAALTSMTSTIAETGVFETHADVDPKTREKWRKKVLAQSSVIARIQARRFDAEAELNRLERGRLDGRALDRIAKAERNLQTIDTEIKSEKKQLSRIIRQARKEGAEPGWFR